MGLIDTHTHLDSFARRGELPLIVQRAGEAGVEGVVAIGTDVDDWSLYRGLIGSAGRSVVSLHYAVGLHPCNVGEDWAARVAQIESFWEGGANPPAVAPFDELRAMADKPDEPLGKAARRDDSPYPVALGEIGLDRFHLPKDAVAAETILGWQRAAFAEQLKLARRLGCPVVIHSRGAFAECVEMIDQSGVAWNRVVFHCFTEGPAEMAELVRRGGYGSFTGVITYKNAEAVRAAALAQGLERLMIETDAPYLSPMPHRGKPNEPAYLRHTAESCAGLFGVSYERLAEVTTATAKKFFGLSP